MLDIDHFKDYNDALGHLAGDVCLKTVSRTLQSFCRRPSDLAVRFGGDELGLLLAETQPAEALTIAEELRQAVSDLAIAFGTSKVTISAGVASLIPSRGQAAEVLHVNADKALYAAKRDGRNRTVGV